MPRWPTITTTARSWIRASGSTREHRMRRAEAVDSRSGSGCASLASCRERRALHGCPCSERHHASPRAAGASMVTAQMDGAARRPTRNFLIVPRSWAGCFSVGRGLACRGHSCANASGVSLRGSCTLTNWTSPSGSA
jgi:hypothetical protein